MQSVGAENYHPDGAGRDLNPAWRDVLALTSRLSTLASTHSATAHIERAAAMTGRTREKEGKARVIIAAALLCA